jgi:hypothetical protein
VLKLGSKRNLEPAVTSADAAAAAAAAVAAAAQADNSAFFASQHSRSQVSFALIKALITLYAYCGAVSEVH